MGALPLALLGAFLSAQAPPPSRPEQPLRPGQSRYELTGLDALAHTVALEPGQFVRVAVVQAGTDVTVAVVAPGGARTEIDVPDSGFGKEPASLLADTGGTYTVEVRSKGPAPAGAAYVIESEPPRAATDLDRTRLRAERALAESAQLLRKPGPDSGQATVAKLGAALLDWRTLGDRAGETEALLQRAAAYLASGDFSKVVEDGTAALALASSAGDAAAAGRAHFFIGSARQLAYDYDPAVDHFEQALAIRRALGDRRGEIDALRHLGRSYSGRGELRRHIETGQAALALSRKLGDRESEGEDIHELAAAYANVGELQKALDLYRESAAIWRALGNLENEAVTLFNVGAVHKTLGDYAGALAAYEETLPMWFSTGNRRKETNAYHNMGDAYAALGDSQRALEYFNKSLVVSRATQNRAAEGITLAYLGIELIKLREYEKAAAPLEEALRVAAEVNSQWFESAALMGLGRLHMETGRAAEARGEFQRAAELSRAVGNQTRQADAIYMLARIANQAGDLDEARRQAEAALAVLETIRRRLTNPTLRSTFVASVRDTYEIYVDVLMGLHRQRPGQGFDERGLEAAEMGRARGLLDMLNEAGLQVSQGVDASMMAEERAAQERLDAALDRQLRISQRAHTEDQAEAANRGVQMLTADWVAARDRIRTQSPRFAALREPTPSSVTEIRSDVLDADTVLLEYALGERRSTLWVLTREALATHELPGRAAIEKAARDAQAALGDPGRASADVLALLGEMVLGPAKGSLGVKRLLIVSDGALHYVPFAALPDPDRPREPLLARHELVSAPSASVLALLRRDSQRRPPASRTLAVLADPVFERDDERLHDRKAAAVKAAAPSPAPVALQHAMRDAGVEGGLPRLPFTRREAEAILGLVPARERKAALDFDASRATVSDPSLAAFRLVHFATHGFLNSAQPELSGLVLSLLDRQGNDARGFLTATDVFNLHLNADLVVLSGCRTALGKDMRGEGLVGLSRGFMYAGATRVMASLWKVDDAATAELMKTLYRGILKGGLSPAAALRAAQLDLRRRERFRDPFYWGAFQLQGEWR